MGYVGYITGIYWDNGKEHGNYYLGLVVSIIDFTKGWNFRLLRTQVAW